MLFFLRKIRRKLLTNNKPALPTGRVTTYLLYAIGEIVLVVIGILIAVSINNWNEERKNHNKIEKYTQLLIRDLVSDSTAIAETIEIMESESERFDQFQQRLTAPSATIDSLFQIFQYEFPFLTYGLEPLSDNTFRVLTTTGDIGLFPDSLSNALFSLSRMQKETILARNTSWEIFLTTVTHFTRDFPLPLSFSMINSGPLYERTLTFDTNKFITGFNSVALAKQNVYRQGLRALRELRLLTNELLKTLREFE